MSFVDFKEVTAPTAGSNVKYGSQDILDIMQILNGKIVATRRPHIINPWRFDSSFDMKEIATPANPSSGYQTFYVDSASHRPSFKDSSGAIFNFASGLPTNRRWGAYQPVSPNGAATVNNVGILDGILTAHVPTGAGTPTVTYDTSEGLLINLVSGIVAGNNAGLISNTTATGIGRRLWGMKIEARFSMTSTSLGRVFCGFTSATAPPNNAQPLATTDSGIYVGYNETGTGSTNWSIFHNDGATSVTVDNVGTGIAKNTAFHTVGISWTASSNITVTFDGVAQTISTDLPLTTANLFFNLYAQASSTTAKTLLVDYVYIEAEK